MCPPSESAYCYVYQTDTAEFIKGCLDYDDPSNVMAAAWPRDQKCITILPSPDPAHPGTWVDILPFSATGGGGIRSLVILRKKYVVKHKSAKLFMTYAVGKLEAALNKSHNIKYKQSEN